MKTAACLLLAALLAGCGTSPHVREATIQSLREYRAARMAENVRARITVTIRDERVQALASAEPAGEEYRALREALARDGRNLARRFGLRQVDEYPLPSVGFHVHVFEADDARSLDRLMPELEQQPGVESVERMSLYRTEAVSPPDASDPLASLQVLPEEVLRELHTIGTGRGTTIAVIDTGIDTAHEDLRDADLSARDLVGDHASMPPENHATAVAGLILAQPDNGIGLRGIAPGARVIVLRACWQDFEADAAFCNTFTLAKALAAALEAEVDIVNLSLTGPMDPLLAQLVDRLLERNVIVIAANRDQRDQGAFPSELPGVIAATARPLLAADANLVFAPGQNVLSLLPDNRYGLHDGSSISAAQVSGIAGLFRERDPDIDADRLRSLLRGHGVEREGLPGLVEALRSLGME